MHYVYIVRCADNSLYTGYTTDVERRVQEHNGDIPNVGARYTRSRRPVEVVYQKAFKSRSAATKHEAVIKKLSRKEKVALYNFETDLPCRVQKKI